MEDDMFLISGRGTMCSQCGQRPPDIGTMCSQCAYGGGSSGPRGNSYALGPNGASGPAMWSWRGGYQAPRPVTHWDFTEGRLDG